MQCRRKVRIPPHILVGTPRFLLATHCSPLTTHDTREQSLRCRNVAVPNSSKKSQNPHPENRRVRHPVKRLRHPAQISSHSPQRGTLPFPNPGPRHPRSETWGTGFQLKWEPG